MNNKLWAHIALGIFLGFLLTELYFSYGIHINNGEYIKGISSLIPALMILGWLSKLVRTK